MPVSRPRDQIGGGRRDDDEIGVLRQSDVIEGVPSAEELGVGTPASDGFERNGADELLCGAGEYCVYEGSGLREQAGQPDCLVAGDAARNAEEDPAVVERARGATPTAVAARSGPRGMRCSPC